MLEELRVNPRSPGARLWSRRPGERGVSRSVRVRPSLSTGFPVKVGELGTCFHKRKERVE